MTRPARRLKGSWTCVQFRRSRSARSFAEAARSDPGRWRCSWLSLGAGTASAGVGQRATFTKWVTDWPNMAGVVGGSVGDGAFSGKVIDYNPGPTTVIAAIYHFDGSAT